MNAKELMIGNWVYSNFTHENIQISALIESTEINANPIELTEEWITNFGWVWNEECDSFEKYPNGDTRMNLKKDAFGYVMFNYVMKAVIAKKIMYVHQLQNLYFALTGKHLNLVDQ